MAYEKLNLTDGTVFTAAHVAHIEDGIDSAMAYRRQLTSDDDCNSLEDGAYWYSTSSPPANAPFANAAVMFVFGGGNRQIQLGFRYGQAGSGRFRAKQDGSWRLWAEFAGLLGTEDYPGCYCRFNGDVQEWVNPPMIAGVEYLTTERYKGSPVYVQMIDLGTLPATGKLTIDHNISMTQKKFVGMDAYAVCSDAYLYKKFPVVNQSGNVLASIDCLAQKLEVVTSTNMSNYTGFAILKYRKP